MEFGVLRIIVLLIIGIGWYNLADAVCHECQENNMACVNQTSYHPCFGASTPNTDQLFTCPEGLVCTNLPIVCFQRNTFPASCGDTSSCGICNSNQTFACTSRTTFAFCFGATIPSDVVGTCPKGLTCDASSPKYCVEELQPTSIVCDREETNNASLFYGNLYDVDVETGNIIGH